MRTYKELTEVKFRELNKVGKTGTVEKMQKGAHSQGYTVSDPKMQGNQGDHMTVDVTHRKTGEKIKNVKGGSFGGSVSGRSPNRASSTDNTFRNQVAASIQADAVARGRKDKRPAAKAARKEQDRKNKEAKMAKRRPFKTKIDTKTRKVVSEHNEWWINMWRLDEAEGFAGKPPKPDNDPKKAAAGMGKKLPDTHPKSELAIKQRDVQRRLNLARQQRAASKTRPDPGAKGSPGMSKPKPASRQADPRAQAAGVRKDPGAPKGPATPQRTMRQAPKPKPKFGIDKKTLGDTRKTPYKGADKMTANVNDGIRPAMKPERNRPQEYTPSKQAKRNKKEEGKASRELKKRDLEFGTKAKRALGGDLIGMRAKGPETRQMKAKRQEQNQKRRSQATQKAWQDVKKAQQAGVDRDGGPGEGKGTEAKGSQYINRDKRS